MAQVPDAWLWAVLQQLSKESIDIKVIDTLTEKSSTKLYQIIFYVTGLDRKVAIQDELLDQSVLFYVLKGLIDWRGDLLNACGGLLQTGFRCKQIVYEAPHGVFSLLAKGSSGGDEKLVFYGQVSTQKLK